MLSNLRRSFSLKSSPSVAALIVMALGGAVLAGWAFDIGVLKRIAPGWIAMSPITAISFILAGVSLLLRQPKQPDARAQWLSVICAGFVLALAGLTLCEYVFNWNANIDQVLFREATGSITTAYPGRMAATTAINFALIALALIALNGKSKWSYRLADLLASGVELLSLAVLLTYIYDISYLNGTAAYTQMALHSALGFIVLCAGLLLIIPNSVLVSLISGNQMGSVLVRRLLPAAILVPSILTWLHFLGERADLYDSVTGAAILGVATVIFFSLVIMWSARQLNQIDAGRRRAEAARITEHNLLRTLVDNLPDYIFAKDIEGRFLLSNAAHTQSVHGASPDSLVGKTALDLFPPHLATQFHDDDVTILETGQALINAERVTLGADGQERIVLTTKVPLRNAEGAVIGLVGVSRDVTKRKQAEAALRTSEARYHSLFENMLNGLAYCKMEFEQDQPKDFIYLEVNQAFESLTGLRQVSGKKVSDVIPGIRETAPGLFEIYSRVALTGKPEQIETYVQSLDTWFSIAVYSPAREYFVAIFDVITERKRAEATLRASEAAEHEQRILAEALRDTAKVLVSSLDPDAVMARILENVGRVVPHEAANMMLVEGNTARLVSWLGYPAAYAQTFKTIQVSLKTPNLDTMLSTHAPVLVADTAAYPGWIRLRETEWVHSYVGAPIQIRNQVIGFLNLDSAQTGFFTTTHAERLQAFADQAALAIENAQLYDALRRHAEDLEQHVALRTAELQRSKDHIEAILNNSSDAILVIQANGTITQINPTFSALFGYPAEEMTGRPFAGLAAPDQADWIMSVFSNVTASRTAKQIEMEAYRRDGTHFSADVGLAPILDRSTTALPITMLEIVCSIRDVTEHKRVERELQALNQMKTDFISTAAHELRTPLTTVQGFSELLVTREMDSQRVKHYLHIINEHSTQLRRIIEALLDLSRLESTHALALEVQPVDLAELVEKIRAPFAELSPLHHFHIDGIAMCPVISADAFRLGQVIQNLLSNAVKYSPRGGGVTIRGQVMPNCIKVSIQDEGIGMTPEQQTHLFERFYRANTSNTAIGGTGLGLAISKLIIELHGGQMWAKSQAGIGSTFYFTLPRADPSR